MPRRTARSDRSWRRSPYLWAGIAGLVLIPAMRPFLRFEPEPPPRLFELPAFSLVDQSAAPYGSRDLEGHVYVANVFFTGCSGACRSSMELLAQLAERLETSGVDDVKLLSVSVDPAHDQPRVLDQYARADNILERRWRLLTGSAEDVRGVVSGLRLSLEAEASPLADSARFGRLVLVDDRGFVRGDYEASAIGIDEVFFRAQHVLGERSPRR